MGKMWFGNLKHAQNVPDPASGMQKTRTGFHTTSQLENGGVAVERSTAKHTTYGLDFPVSDISRYEGLETFNYFAEGYYGDGCVYYMDPMHYDTNLMPAQWASPGLVEQGWPSMVPGSTVTFLDSTAPRTVLPPRYMAITGTPRTTFYRGAEVMTLLVPEGYTLWFGFVGSGSGIKAEYVERSGTRRDMGYVSMVATDAQYRLNRSVNGNDFSAVRFRVQNNGYFTWNASRAILVPNSFALTPTTWTPDGVALVNQAAYGSFETAQSGTAEVRRNFAINPSLRTGTDYWSTRASTGGALSGVRETTGGPNGLPFYSATLTAKPANWWRLRFAGNPITGGGLYTISAWVRATAVVSGPVQIIGIRSDGSESSTNITVPLDGTWNRISAQVNTGSNINSLVVEFGFGGNGTVGDTIAVTGVLIEQTDQIRPYFDGSSPNEKGFTTEWAGTANASASIMRAATVSIRENFVSNPSGGNGTNGWATAGGGGVSGVSVVAVTGQPFTTAMQATVNAPSQRIYFETISGAAGRVGGAAWVNLPAGMVANLNVLDYGGGFPSSRQTASITGTGGWQMLSGSWSDTTTTGSRLEIRYGSGPAGNIQVAVMTAVTSESNVNAFDGSTPNSGDFINAWSGAANASTSVQQGVLVSFMSHSANTGYPIHYMRLAGSGGVVLQQRAPFNSDQFIEMNLTGQGFLAMRGKVFTMAFYVTPLDIPYNPGMPIARFNTSGPGGSDYQPSAGAAIAVGERYLKRLFFDWTNVTGVNFARLMQGVASAGARAVFEDLTVVEGNHPNLMPFDGSTPSDPPGPGGFFYGWTGTSFASQSAKIAYAPGNFLPMPYAGETFTPGRGTMGMTFGDSAIAETYIMTNRHLAGLSTTLIENEPWKRYAQGYEPGWNTLLNTSTGYGLTPYGVGPYGD